MVTNYELRKNARAQLGGNIFANQWLMMLLVCIIVSAINGVASSVVIGALLVTGPLSYGLARVTTDRVRGKNVEIGDLFKGFTDNFGQSCLLGVMIYVFTFLWSLLFIIPGIVKAYSYSMAYYIQQADPSKDWREALNESKAMMKGHKGQLFCLDLSFIGWYLLGTLCCCVGVLFVTPYHETARANFYMALKASQTPAEEGFETSAETDGASESL